MKSFLIIGLSTYGVHLCKELARLDNEIMIADKDPAVVDAMASCAWATTLRRRWRSPICSRRWARKR